MMSSEKLLQNLRHIQTSKCLKFPKTNPEDLIPQAVELWKNHKTRLPVPAEQAALI